MLADFKNSFETDKGLTDLKPSFKNKQKQNKREDTTWLTYATGGFDLKVLNS